MSEVQKIVVLTESELEQLLKRAVAEALESKRGHETGDRLIDRDEAEGVLAVSGDWLYRYGKKLGLTRKVKGKVNYSWLAIQKFIATRKTS